LLSKGNDGNAEKQKIPPLAENEINLSAFTSSCLKFNGAQINWSDECSGSFSSVHF
jgi:hypothetical protein